MDQDLSPIAAARVASALTTEDACTITGMSKGAYERAEEHPLEFTLGELKVLLIEFNSDGRLIVHTWLDSLAGIC